MISELRLEIVQRRAQSMVGDCFVSSPLKVLALPQQAGQALSLMLMSASPGLLDGDQQSFEVTLAENTRLHLQTQAYQRIFATHSQAQQHTTLHLKPHSQLTYTPHPLVLHEAASLQLSNTIHLADDVQLIWAEIIASGRKQCGESFAFKKLASLTRVFWNQRLLLRDNLQWQPERQVMDSPVHMAEYSHQATLYFANTVLDFDMKATVNALYASLNELEDFDVYFGVSLVHPKLIVVRMLAQQAEFLFAQVKNISQQLNKFK